MSSSSNMAWCPRCVTRSTSTTSLRGAPLAGLGKRPCSSSRRRWSAVSCRLLDLVHARLSRPPLAHSHTVIRPVDHAEAKWPSAIAPSTPSHWPSVSSQRGPQCLPVLLHSFIPPLPVLLFFHSIHRFKHSFVQSYTLPWPLLHSTSNPPHTHTHIHITHTHTHTTSTSTNPKAENSPILQRVVGGHAQNPLVPHSRFSYPFFMRTRVTSQIGLCVTGVRRPATVMLGKSQTLQSSNAPIMKPQTW